MEIEVKLFATLREYLPKGSSRFSCKMEVDGSTRIQDILSRLKLPEEIPKIILINGIHGKKEQILKDGDVVSIFPPVAGGWLMAQWQMPKFKCQIKFKAQILDIFDFQFDIHLTLWVLKFGFNRRVGFNLCRYFFFSLSSLIFFCNLSFWSDLGSNFKALS